MSVETIFELAAIILLFATLIVAAVTDLLHHRVYNWTTFPAIAFGLALGYGVGGLGRFPSLRQLQGSGLLDHVAGLAVGFGIFFAVYLATRRGDRSALGLGDVKLIAAIGAIGGFHFAIGAMFWGSLVGALMATWVLVWRGRLVAGLRRSFRFAFSVRAGDGKEPEGEADLATLRIPYGVAISFGTVWAWFLMELPRA